MYLKVTPTVKLIFSLCHQFIIRANAQNIHQHFCYCIGKNKS